jgi:hypothetical protein
MPASQAPPPARLEPHGPSASDVWLSRPQAVAVLGLPLAQFDALVREGKVACRRVGTGHPRFSLRSVRAIAASGPELGPAPSAEA